MAGIAALKKRGGIDTARIGVSGWSFGGFVTGWLIGHYPDFRAAVAGAAALDFFDMWSLSDLGPQRRHALAGSPWARQEFFTEHSPLTHAGADPHAHPHPFEQRRCRGSRSPSPSSCFGP